MAPGNKRRRGWLALVALLVALPLLPLVVWAFAGAWRFPDLLPSELSLRGWEYVVGGGGRAPEAIANSLLIGVAATIASVAVGLPAGMALGG